MFADLRVDSSNTITTTAIWENQQNKSELRFKMSPKHQTQKCCIGKIKIPVITNLWHHCTDDGNFDQRSIFIEHVVNFAPIWELN